MPRTKKSTSSVNQTEATPVNQLTYLQIRKESNQDREERELQYEVEDNLRNLMADISATSRDLAAAERNRQSFICKGEVDWSNLINHDIKIEGLRRGLDRLKNYRENYFPNWKEIVAEP